MQEDLSKCERDDTVYCIINGEGKVVSKGPNLAGETMLDIRFRNQIGPYLLAIYENGKQSRYGPQTVFPYKVDITIERAKITKEVSLDVYVHYKPGDKNPNIDNIVINDGSFESGHWLRTPAKLIFDITE